MHKERHLGGIDEEVPQSTFLISRKVAHWESSDIRYGGAALTFYRILPSGITANTGRLRPHQMCYRIPRSVPGHVDATLSSGNRVRSSQQKLCLSTSEQHDSFIGLNLTSDAFVPT